jgi:hypothetical protein
MVRLADSAIGLSQLAVIATPIAYAATQNHWQQCRHFVSCVQHRSLFPPVSHWRVYGCASIVAPVNTRLVVDYYGRRAGGPNPSPED